jgi:hypothetical protein
MKPTLFALSVLALGSSALAGDLHTVSAAGTGDFLDVQSAVDFAAEGDTILIEGGSYFGADVLVQGKSLTFAEGGGGEPRLFGTFQINGLAAGQELHLQGVFVRAVEVQQCQGQVLLEDLNVGTAFAAQGSLRVEGCTAVTAARCDFFGLDGFSITGGQSNNGADGEAAIRVTQSKLTLYSCQAEGGWGDDGAWLPCGVGGDGGPGLHVTDSSSTVRTFDTTLQGGLEGLGGCGDGSVGSPLIAPSGVVVPLSMSVSSLTGPGVAPAGSTVLLQYTGPSGAQPLLVSSAGLGTRSLPPQIGSLHVLAPFTVDVLPPIPASGSASYVVQLGTLPPGIESDWMIFQLALVEPSGRYLGPPRGLTVVR